MKKNKTVKKSISSVICAGLLISSLPATLPIMAQQPIMQPGVPQKLSQKEIKQKIRTIKTTIRVLNIVNVVLPVVIGAAGITVFIVAGGVAIWKLPKLVKQIWSQFGKVSPTEKMMEMTVEDIQWARIFPVFIAIGAFTTTTIATFVSAIGLTSITIGVAFGMASELDRMEKNHPGTLTDSQKRTLLKLKNMAKGPAVRGIIKFFALKDAQKAVAAAVLEKNPALLVSTLIVFGQPKKTRGVIAKYIKLKWMEQNARNAVEQLAKETKPELQKYYKKAVKKLQKEEQQIKKIEAKHPSLAKIPVVVDAVQEFRQKADDILEGLKKPVLEEEIQRSELMIVPL